MPIRINLLAEAQELDESRRKDPVKRIILWGVVCLALMLGWSATLFGKSMMAKSEANRIEVSISALSNDYRQVLDNQKTLGEDKRKLDALRAWPDAPHAAGDSARDGDRVGTAFEGLGSDHHPRRVALGHAGMIGTMRTFFRRAP